AGLEPAAPPQGSAPGQGRDSSRLGVLDPGRRRPAGGLRDESHVLPCPATPHRDRAGATGPREARHAPPGRDDHPAHHRAGPGYDHPDALLQPRAKGGQAVSGPSVPGTASDITTSSVDPQGDWDAIVVGGGHNGLTAAAYLAKSGMRTLVLEQRHLVGGAAITEELRPGF